MLSLRLSVRVLAVACLWLSSCAFDDVDPASETIALSQGGSAGACSPEGFPAGRGNPQSCCQDGNRTWHTNDGKNLGYRVFANPCTEADGVSKNCTGRECVYGPCGARIEWAVTAESVRVFVPDSHPGKCGWEVKNVVACKVGCDWPAGTTREFPESFAGQAPYEGLTASCPYSTCGPGGVPLP